MSAHVELELRKLVERVVRPVVALRVTKRKMREELLAHLTAVFGEELAATSDETSAVARTRTRFGELLATTAALQASVSARERFFAPCERYTQPTWEPSDTLASLLGRQAAQIGVNLAVLFPLMLTLGILTGRGDAIAFTVRLSVGMSIVLPIFGSLLTFLPINFGDAIFGPADKRSWRFILAYVVATLLILPAIAFFFNFVLTGNFAASVRHGLIGCYVAPINLFLCLVAGRLAYQESRGDRAWDLLNLDP